MAAEEPDKPANPRRITRARPPAESDAQPPWQPPTSDAHIEDDETGEFLPGTSGATPDGRAAPDDSPLPVATSSSNLPSMLLEAAAAADAEDAGHAAASTPGASGRTEQLHGLAKGPEGTPADGSGAVGEASPVPPVEPGDSPTATTTAPVATPRRSGGIGAMLRRTFLGIPDEAEPPAPSTPAGEAPPPGADGADQPVSVIGRRTMLPMDLLSTRSGFDEPKPTVRRVRTASGSYRLEFPEGDSKKPQLSATYSGHGAPAPNLGPTRSKRPPSQPVMPPGRGGAEPLPFHLTMHQPPQQEDAIDVISSVDESPAGANAAQAETEQPQQTYQQVLERMRTPEATEERIQREMLLEAAADVDYLDARWIALAAVGCVAAAFALPATVHDSGPFFDALLRPLAVAHPWFLRLAAGLGLGAGVILAVAGSQADLHPDNPAGQRVGPAAFFAVVLGILAGVAREAADPTSTMMFLEPLRHTVLGAPIWIWAALAGGGVVHLADLPGSRLGRVVAGIGTAGLAYAVFMPVGWLGESHIPVWTALTHLGDAMTDPTSADVVSSVVMKSPFATLVMAWWVLVLTALLFSARVPSRFVLHVLGIGVVLLQAWPFALEGWVGVGVAMWKAGLGLLVAAVVIATLQRSTYDLDADASNRFERFAALAIVLCFCLLKWNGLKESATDEGIYFYAAKRWAEGVWPYHDFFFSHPPLHIAAPMALYKLFGFQFIVGKLLSAAASLMTGVAVWQLARGHLGRVWAILAMGFFLFAAEVLKASTNLTGVNLTTMWLALGLWMTMDRRPLLGGVLFAFAATTGFYAVGAAAVLAVLLLFAEGGLLPDGKPDPRAATRLFNQPGLRFIVGFGFFFALINVLGAAVGGDNYVESVYRYHTLKAAKVAGYRPPSEGIAAILGNVGVLAGSRDLTISVYYHAMHYWLALLAPVGVALGLWLRREEWNRRRALIDEARERRRAARAEADAAAGKSAKKRRKGAKDRDDERVLPPETERWYYLVNPRLWFRYPKLGGLTMICAVLALGLLGEFAQFAERYDFYYTLIMPLLALLAASWIRHAAQVGRAAIGAGLVWRGSDAAGDPVALRLPTWQMRGLTIAVFAVSMLWMPLDLAANAKAFPSEVQPSGRSKGAGERLDFEWTPAPEPAWTSELTEALFWKPFRLRGSIEWGVHHYLWSKKRWFSSAPEIARWIDDNTRPDETIMGSSQHTPTIALLANRRLAADHVDTNAKVFKTGVVALSTFWNRVCDEKLRYIIAGPHAYFSPRGVRKMPTVVKHFRPVKQFSDPHLKHWRSVTIEVWERRTPAGSGPACRFEPR